MSARISRMTALILISIVAIFGSIAGLAQAAAADAVPTASETTADHPWDLNGLDDHPWDLNDHPWDTPSDLSDHPWD